MIWSRGEYFDMWKNFLEDMCSEISSLRGVSRAFIQEVNSEPFHHLWMGSIKEPHTRHLILNIEVASEFEQVIEFSLVPECIFCSYAAIPLEFTTSDPITQNILRMARRFDSPTDTKNTQLFSSHQRLMVPTSFPSGYPPPSMIRGENLLTKEKVWEAITICMNLRGDLGKLTTDYGCSPFEILGHLENHLRSLSIPISFFRDLHGLATQLDKDPFYLLRSGKATDLLKTAY
jgi:hypothetical protein